jgi:putative salt-induced outer membrane protein YdiY
MKSVDESYRKEPLDGFFFVEISDFVAAAIVGGAVAGVTANAYATGDSALTSANTHTSATQFPWGGSIAQGYGTAVASGNNPSSNVNAFGSGDIVLTYSSTYSTKKKSVSTGYVFALDLP